MNKKQKKVLYRIIICAVVLVLLHFIPVENKIILVGLYLIPYWIIGEDVIKKALKGIKNKQVFDENFLMAVATVGAFGLGDYNEAVAVMLFYQIGELFQSYAVGKSRKNIAELMDIRPDYANIEVDGSLEQVDPDEVEIGTIVVIQPGERVPLDGIVVEGNSSLNTANLTGESVPRSIKAGEEIFSGCINIEGVLKVRTTKEFGESTVSKILDLVENASSRKSKSENFISKFAAVYTPAVCYGALALAVIPPVVLLITGNNADFSTWLYRALTFLVISCPCALVVSIPLSFFAGLGGASNQGILIKGSNYLETLSQVKYVVFDKTGTITKGVFEVNEVHQNTMDEKELLRLAAHAEHHSNHPIAKSIKKSYDQPTDGNIVSEVQEISGHGIVANIEGKTVAAGNSKLMKKLNIAHQPCDDAGTIIHIAVDNNYEGHIVINDVIKENSPSAINELNRIGITTIMLTGDNKNAALDIAGKVGIKETHYELLPQNKVEILEEILAKADGKVAFAGDGINDAPVLSRADIGIAMGALGSDAAIEAADVVLMDDDLGKIVKGIKISKKCIGIVYQNIYFAIGVKVLCLLLTTFGYANMWAGIFADVGVMIIAVINAIRALFVKRI